MPDNMCDHVLSTVCVHQMCWVSHCHLPRFRGCKEASRSSRSKMNDDNCVGVVSDVAPTTTDSSAALEASVNVLRSNYSTTTTLNNTSNITYRVFSTTVLRVNIAGGMGYHLR